MHRLGFCSNFVANIKKKSETKLHAIYIKLSFIHNTKVLTLITKKMNTMSLPDARMIEVMEYAVKNGLADNEGDYWERIKFTRTALSNIRKGLQSFRVQHIINACNVTGVSSDWILGIDSSMFKTAQKSVPQALKELATQIEGARQVHHRYENMQFAKNKLHA